MKLQNKISHLFLEGSDLADREKEVLEDASKRLSFTPIKLIDRRLIDEAVRILIGSYRGIKPEFQHGHFSAGDLYKVSKNEVIVLSNLYWSWKPPFYDAIFGYHWFIYHLARLKSPTIEFVEEQRSLWLSKISEVLGTHLKGVKLKLLNLALLERAGAGLNLDALSVDPQSPIAEYLVQTTRVEVKRLIKELL